MKSQRIIRMISEHSKYRRFPYPVIPAFDGNLNTYVTGQHVETGIHTRDEGLTLDEMMGKTPLSNHKKKLYPYVINPTVATPLLHMMKLDLSVEDDGDYVNPKHKAMFDLFLLQPFVALGKDQYVKNKHLFYIEDLEREATVSVEKDELMFKAIQQVMMDTALNKFIELALWLNFSVTSISIDVKRISITQLQKAIYDACKTYPREVLQFYEKTTRESLFVLKLHYYNIIEKRGGMFFDNEQPLGHTPADVITWARKKDNEHYWKHWNELMESFDGKARTLTTGKQKLPNKEE